jgi:RNA polymerase sigma factor (sigma-70 family)
MIGIDFQGETEQSLVAALRQGRQEKLSELYDAYAPILLGMITRIVKDSDLAEQVLQESFVAIWSRIGKYDASKERLLTWGLAIAREIALTAIIVNNNTSTEIAPNISTETPIQQLKVLSLQNGHVKKQDHCTLAPLEKSVLELLYLEGRTCEETAKELSLTVAELRTMLKRAFTHLKAEKSI